MAKTALVVGKFYPPHRGHKFLIDAASETNNIVHVIVCHKSDQIPEGNLRKAWLQEIHPNAIIKVIDDIYDPTDSAMWVQMTKIWLGFIPDVVFTSEDYGIEFSRLLGASMFSWIKTESMYPSVQHRFEPIPGNTGNFWNHQSGSIIR